MPLLASQTLAPGLPAPGLQQRNVPPTTVLTLTVVQTGSFTAASNTLIPVDKSGGNATATLPPAPILGDTIQFFVFGASNTFTLALNGNKFYGGASNPVTGAEGIEQLQWTGVSRGWVDL